MPLQQDQRTQTSKNMREYGETGRHKGLKIRRHPLFLIKTNYN